MAEDIFCDFRHQPRRLAVVELIIEDIPGGGVICKDDFKTTSTVMKEGALLGVDANKVYHLTKTAEVWDSAASGATEIKVYPAHEFKSGEFLIDTPKLGTSREILSIENSDISYDTLTLDEPLGIALNIGDILIQSAASGMTGANAEYKYSPVAVATQDMNLLAGNTGAGLMVRGTCKEVKLPFKIDSIIKSLLPLIRFI